MRRTIACGAMALGLALSARVVRADPPARADIESALRGFEHGASDAQIRAWGAASVDSFVSIADDAHEPEFVRTRAVYALRLFPTATPVRPYLLPVAHDTSAPLAIRRAALDAIALGLGDLDEVATMLRDPDVRIRDGAAWSLAHVNTPAAQARLRAALPNEHDAAVRRTIERALGVPAP